jgi:hypothetical protein
MTARKRAVPLLHGPYTAPALRRGDRADCLVRDRMVVVTTYSDAPISWPRGYAPSGTYGRGTGLIVDEELARAVRCESALAVSYWWGVSTTTVVKWRKALEVNRRNNEGSQLLIHAATAQAREAALEVGVTGEERERRSRQATGMQLWRFGPPVTCGRPWPPEHIALLGTTPDPEVARRTGHTLNAVRLKRRGLGVPRFRECAPAGASFEPRTGRWYARINVGGRRVSLGTYDSKEEAQRAYQDALRRLPHAASR